MGQSGGSVTPLSNTIIVHNSTSVSDPDAKIEGDIGLNADPEKNVFAWIRANTHHYVTQYDATNDILTCAQLSDNDRTLYEAGGSAPITTVGNDVYGKLPNFWYKIEASGDDYLISAANTVDKTDGTWNEWGDNKFLGTYKAYCESSKVYSVSGKTPTANVSTDTFTSYATAKSKHHSIITWDWHCIFQILFWGIYGNTNSKVILGTGISSNTTATGTNNSLAMTDTTTSDNGSHPVNFLGFEMILGILCEWIGRAKTTSTGILTIYDEDGKAIRTVGNGSTLSGNNIRKVSISQYGDIWPTTTASNNSYNTYYSAYGIVYSGAGLVPRRSDNGSSSGDGFSMLGVNDSGGYSSSSIGSRLAYQGDYKIVDKL